MLAQGADGVAERDVEGKHKRAEEDRAEDEDAPRRAGEIDQGVAFGLPKRTAAVPKGYIEQAE